VPRYYTIKEALSDAGEAMGGHGIREASLHRSSVLRLVPRRNQAL
jgi:hypothetical protein